MATIPLVNKDDLKKEVEDALRDFIGKVPSRSSSAAIESILKGNALLGPQDSSMFSRVDTPVPDRVHELTRPEFQRNG